MKHFFFIILLLFIFSRQTNTFNRDCECYDDNQYFEEFMNHEKLQYIRQLEENTIFQELSKEFLVMFASKKYNSFLLQSTKNSSVNAAKQSEMHQKSNETQDEIILTNDAHQFISNAEIVKNSRVIIDNDHVVSTDGSLINNKVYTFSKLIDKKEHSTYISLVKKFNNNVYREVYNFLGKYLPKTFTNNYIFKKIFDAYEYFDKYTHIHMIELAKEKNLITHNFKIAGYYCDQKNINFVYVLDITDSENIFVLEYDLQDRCIDIKMNTYSRVKIVHRRLKPNDQISDLFYFRTFLNVGTAQLLIRIFVIFCSIFVFLCCILIL
ncbi:hypothetical protein EDEG_03052 [Edhazardia aedis USNM 41457]|uniref:Uncharacterized protein n=1 Tax=Edhazardia aedis (strain USNM 41457) TaxID=1003232 RepID=J9DIV4_EDHAE|nr:hypothetical protein EDEG_03052 [Edhazardia aedis USNM 41457]|eukprot:EJW02540.1 hypothetical protein EDEG_03052 [Edhazardia aedis USNM 41457]